MSKLSANYEYNKKYALAYRSKNGDKVRELARKSQYKIDCWKRVCRELRAILL